MATTRDATTGEKQIEGDYLLNAQGEDVVAGTRVTERVSKLKDDMPEVWDEFEEITQKLEQHYREMQDVEFTVERGKLWMLQTRDGKRTAQAAVRIAVDQAEEDLISREEAVLRVSPEQIDFFLHPQFPVKTKKKARLLANGLNVSPGAAVGVVAMDADLAEQWSEEGKQVIMVPARNQTGRCTRHVGGTRNFDQPRWSYQSCSPGSTPIWQTPRWWVWPSYK